MRMLIPAAAAFTAVASVSAAAQIVPLPSQQQEARCVAEEQQRDRQALRRFGQRTRDEREIRDYCRGEVMRRFDERVLGRPSPLPLPALAGPSDTPASAPPSASGAVGSRFLLGGSWHYVLTEPGPGNRFAWFIDTALMQRGPEGSGWLLAVGERPARGGVASGVYWVRIDCATGRWAYRYTAQRDAQFRVLSATGADNGWRNEPMRPGTPIAQLRAALCQGASPGQALPPNLPSPSDWARAWFAQNPR